jgi:phytoene synthase
MIGHNAGDSSSTGVVRDAARAGDIDRYLSALLAPRRVREDLIALTAFLGEVARIPAVVSEPMMGEIRLQWWREALAAASAGAATGSPIADALGRVMQRHALPEGLLQSLIDARGRDLDIEQGPRVLAGGMPDLGGYLLATEGAAFRLSARVLGVNEGPPVADLLAAAAQAYGRARMARRAAQAGISHDTALYEDARSWLAEARRLVPLASPALLPAILPVALVEPYLAALQRLGPDGARQGADISPLTRVWRLWWASARGRI